MYRDAVFDALRAPGTVIHATTYIHASQAHNTMPGGPYKACSKDGCEDKTTRAMFGRDWRHITYCVTATMQTHTDPTYGPTWDAQQSVYMNIGMMFDSTSEFWWRRIGGRYG